jgi:hypothetical protein
MRNNLIGAAALAGWALSVPALAGGVPSDGLKAKDVADWLNHQHLQAEADEDRSGGVATVIRTSADGVPFAIYLYDCRKDRCASMQYAASFPAAQGLSLARINAWNRQSRYVRAYLDGSGRVLGEYDVDIAPGLDQKALDHSLTRWRSALSRFRMFVSLP